MMINNNTNDNNDNNGNNDNNNKNNDKNYFQWYERVPLKTLWVNDSDNNLTKMPLGVEQGR